MITILKHFSVHTNANSLSYYKFYIYSYLQNNFPFFCTLNYPTKYNLIFWVYNLITIQDKIFVIYMYYKLPNDLIQQNI